MLSSASSAPTLDGQSGSIIARSSLLIFVLVMLSDGLTGLTKNKYNVYGFVLQTQHSRKLVSPINHRFGILSPPSSSLPSLKSTPTAAGSTTTVIANGQDTAVDENDCGEEDDDDDIDFLFEEVDEDDIISTPNVEVSERVWRYVKKPLLRIGVKGATLTHGNSLRQLLEAHTVVKVKVNTKKFDGSLAKAFETLRDFAVENGAPEGIELIQARDSDKIILFGMPGTLELMEKGEFPPPTPPKPSESTE